jgi:probable rRNA maturation factor
MSVAVHVAADGVRIPLARARVEDVVRAVLRREEIRDAMLSVTFVTNRRSAMLNREHLAHRGPTDVISFGFARPAPDAPVIGDVYIAPAVARANALAHGAGVREELLRLVIHGVLHVLGHDHPDGADRAQSPMWLRQERYVRALTRTPRGGRAASTSTRHHARRPHGGAQR